MSKMSDLDLMIEEFLEFLKELQEAHWKQMEFTYAPAPIFSLEVGKKYIRIVKSDISFEGVISSRSAFGFIRMEDMTLWKCAGWKAPYLGKNKDSVRGMLNSKDTWNKGWLYGIS